MSTSTASTESRSRLPLADACCAPLLREPITASQAAELARMLKALAGRPGHAVVGTEHPTRGLVVTRYGRHREMTATGATAAGT